VVDGLRFSCRARKTRAQGKIPGCQFGEDARLCVQPAPAAVCGCQGPPGLHYAYDWETSDRLLSNGSIIATAAIRRHPELASSVFPRAGAADSRNYARQGARELLTTPYKNPVGGNEEASRSNLREAARLLKEAGFENRDRKLVDPPASLSVSSSSARSRVTSAACFLQAVSGAAGHHREHSLGRQRAVPEPLRSFDFDIVTTVCRSRCHRATSNAISSGRRRRTARFAQPSRHQESGGRCLIDRIIFAKDRAELVASCKAWIGVALELLCRPQFAAGSSAPRAGRFSHPEPLPKYGVSDSRACVWDAEKAAKTGGRS